MEGSLQIFVLSRAYGGCLNSNPDHWTTCVPAAWQKQMGTTFMASVQFTFSFFCADRRKCSPHALTHPETRYHAGIASLHSRSSRHGASARVMVRPLRMRTKAPVPDAPCSHAPSTPAARRRPRCSAAAARSRRSGCGASSPPASCSGCARGAARAASLRRQQQHANACATHRTQRLPLLNLASTLLMSQLSGKRSERV